jgi:hypothetical protein
MSSPIDLRNEQQQVLFIFLVGLIFTLTDINERKVNVAIGVGVDVFQQGIERGSR